MSLKKIIRVKLFACFIAISSPVISNPANPSIINSGPGKNNDAALKPLLERLDEIKNMDKSNLSQSEKKALRKELKEMKKEIKTTHHGVYLSIGAVIIIVLLLIILL